jgi:hypothetical protein
MARFGGKMATPGFYCLWRTIHPRKRGGWIFYKREVYMKKIRVTLFPFLLAVMLAVALAGCGGAATPAPGTPQSLPAQTPSAQDIGQGDTVFAFEVTAADKTVTRFNVHTNEKTVGAALLAVGLIKGETSSSGLYVSEVNGIKADYNTDKSYWAFYVDGQYATAGADATPIEKGGTYAFVYTKA